MLHRRLVAAALIVFPTLGLFWLDACGDIGPPGTWMTALALLVAMLSAAEMIGLLQDNPIRPIAWPAYLGTVCVVVSAAAPEFLGRDDPTGGPIGRWGWVIMSLVLSLFCALLAEMRNFDPQRHSTTRVALSLLVVTYSGGLISFLVAMRMLYPDGWGVLAVFSVLFVVKISDTGAYFTGQALGRHKLAPRLSPGKTVEGVVGGIAAACVAAWLLFTFVVPWLFAGAGQIPLSTVIAYGVTMSAIGVFGDLAESLLKRDMRRKDSSGWLPGLGGVLDMMDSVLITAPIGYLWWASGWLGPS